MLTFLVISSCLVVFAVAIWFMRCGDGRFEFNHVGLFSVGFFYYMLFPLIVGNWDLWPAGDFHDMWQLFYVGVGDGKLCRSLLISMGWYSAFVIASCLFTKKRDYLVLPRDGCAAGVGKRAVTGLVMALSLYLIYIFKDLLFSGYELIFDVAMEGGQWGGALGICALTLLLIYLADIRDVYVWRRKKVGIFLNLHLVCFAIVAVCIASMGSRTVLFLGVVSMMVAYTTLVERMPLRRILLGAIFGIIIFGSIGVWRVKGQFSLNEVCMNALGESMGTSFSYLNEAARGDLDFVKSPLPFLSLFLNLVPTVLLPDKVSLMQTTAVLNDDVYTPFGAENVYMGVMTYFGAVGGGGLFFGLGVFVSKLYNGAINSPRSFAMYTFVTACLVTMLFRDPLQGSIVKHIFEVGVLIPLLLTPFIAKNGTR